MEVAELLFIFSAKIHLLIAQKKTSSLFRFRFCLSIDSFLVYWNIQIGFQTVLGLVAPIFLLFFIKLIENF